MLLGSKRGRGLGFEEPSKGHDDGVLDDARSEHRVARHDQCCQALPVTLVEPHYVADGWYRNHPFVSKYADDQTLAPPRASKRTIDIHAAVAPIARQSAQVSDYRTHTVVDQFRFSFGEGVVNPLCTRGASLAASVCSEIGRTDPAVLDVAYCDGCP